MSAENRLLLLLSLANGVVAIDRLAVNFLSPWIVADLGLSNTELGLLASALSLAVAASGFLVAALADATGRRRQVLIVAITLFSLLSALSGVAQGFLALLLARFVLGVAEGPVVPVGQAMMAAASTPSRRGLNMGVMQNGGAFVLGGMIGPVVMVALAESWGWRIAFFVSAAPGLLLALALARYVVRDATPHETAHRSERSNLFAALMTRNMILSIGIAGLFTGWLIVQNTFLPLYLTSMRGMTPREMSYVLSMVGIAGAVGGLVLPALSDRLGRRPILAMAGFAAMVAPLATLHVGGGAGMMALVILIGWLVIGCAPLYCAIVPAEATPPAHAAAAIAVALASGEIIGGVVMPAIAGALADAHGLTAPFRLCVGLALLCGLLALGLRETAPRLTGANPDTAR